MLKSKKSLAVILSLVMLLAMSRGAWAALMPSADGIYRIGTAEELAEFRDMVNAGSRDLNAKLTANIDLAGIDWTPIGLHVLSDDVTGGTPYNNIKEDLSYIGIFDGAGFKITNLSVGIANTVRLAYSESVNWYSEYAGGIFGVIGSGGKVQNLTAEKANVTLTYDPNGVVGWNAGVIAGGSWGTLSNVHVIDSAVHGTRAGGIAGRNYGLVETSSVYILSATYSRGSTGGIVGRNAAGEIRACTASQVQLLGMYVGGITGLNDAGAGVSGCTVTGYLTTIYATGGTASDRAGGIAGSNAGDIENCLVQNIFTVKGFHAGGIVGVYNGTSVTNCVVSGINEIIGELNAGGVAASLSATISNCIVSGVGSITATDTASDSRAGGIVGRQASDGVVINCAVNDIELIKAANAGGIVGWFHSYASQNLLNCVVYDIGSIIGNTNRFGGVVGHNNNSNAALVADSQYEYGIVSPDRGTGNTARPGTNITSFDGTISSDLLDTLVVLLEQGASHTMSIGETYELDVTALPGTLGLAGLTIAWSTEDLGFVSVEPSAGGLKATVTAVATGGERVTAKVTSVSLNADLTCFVRVLEEGSSTPDADDIVTTTTPADGPDNIYVGTAADITYMFGYPGSSVIVDLVEGIPGLNSSGLSVEIVGGNVHLYGTAITAGTYYYDVTLLVDGEYVLKRIPVIVQGSNQPTGYGGGGSSNCSAGFGATALLSLLGLALVLKRK